MSDDWEQDLKDIFSETFDLRQQIHTRMLRYKEALHKTLACVDRSIAHAEIEQKAVQQIEDDVQKRKLTRAAQAIADREMRRFDKTIEQIHGTKKGV